MSASIPGWKLGPGRLRLDPAVASRTGTHAFTALRQHGPYDNSAVNLTDGSLLFVYPKDHQDLAHRLAEALIKGIGSYPGLGSLFRVTVPRGQAIKSLVVDHGLDDLAAAGRAYRETIAHRELAREPDVAIVLVPHSERFETDSPYYEAKAAFANLALPTQMVTLELLRDDQFNWSVANIALAIFAKLGGIPWAVEAPAGDEDLVIGVGRADVGRGEERQQFFGYAVTFVSNGIYRHTWSFTPTAEEDVYEQRLTHAIEDALRADLDQLPARVVIHLARQTGRREIQAAERAMAALKVDVPVAFLRIDDTSLFDIADTDQATFAPPKGLVARLGPRRALLQAEALGAMGPSDGPLLIEMNPRSTVPVEAFDELVA